MAKGKFQRWLEPDGLILLTGWARDGLTDEQLAKNMGITTATLYEWKNRFPTISETLKKGKEVIDYEVAGALLKRALGYKYKEITREQVRDPETGEYKLQITKEVTKEVAPDVTAQIFWLKNRKPKDWRDKQEIEHSGSVENRLKEMTDEELEKELKRYE